MHPETRIARAPSCIRRALHSAIRHAVCFLFLMRGRDGSTRARQPSVVGFPEECCATLLGWWSAGDPIGCVYEGIRVCFFEMEDVGRENWLFIFVMKMVKVACYVYERFYG